MGSSGPPDGPQLTLLHRSFAAAGASVVSAVVVNPLDVVKTRMQAQGATAFAGRVIVPTTSLLDKWSFAACGQLCVRAADPSLPAGACGAACTTTYTGTLDGLRKIARTEGVGVLWRGTDVALAMAVPMVGIYLPLYDALLSSSRQHGAGAYAPLLAGTLARTAATFCVAPFELVRVRLQAHGPAAAAAAPPRLQPPPLSLLRHVPPAGAGAAAGLRRFGGLWRGVGATLARDVPFSALYWGMVEPIREGLLPAQGVTQSQVLLANITAGMVAGGIAGAVTTPLDVVKTRTQLAVGVDHPLIPTLRSIAGREGVAALFQGWGPRSAKAAPACAIVLSAYELLKHMYDG